MSSEVEVKIPPKLIPAFTAEGKRYRCSYGGRGSGKTRTFAKMLAIRGYMFGKAGVEGVLLCGREFMNSLDESSMEEIKGCIREEPFLSDYYEIGEKYIRSKDGRIRFAFVGLTRNLDSLKSKARILIFWGDEAEAFSEGSLRKLIPTVREEGDDWISELWFTWNPESRRSAVHKRFREAKPDNAVVVEMNWRDNPWFPSVLDEERRADEQHRPETYEHVWEGGMLLHVDGAYYARELNDARTSGRIGDNPVDPDLKVHTAWDLGIGDAMSIWLWQAAPGGIRVVDYIEDHGRSLPDYVKLLNEKADVGEYEFGIDFVPHDAKVRELGTGRTRLETLSGLRRNPLLVPIHAVDDGINAVREVLPLCWFNEDPCEPGLDALRAYRTEYDDNGETFKPRPLHNWASHGADGFRCLAMGYRDLTVKKKPEEPKLPNGAIRLPPAPQPATGFRRTRI